MIQAKQFEAALRELASIRRRLRELLEWERLIREQPKIRREPGFDPATPELRATHADMRSAYGFFLSLICDLREAMNTAAAESAINGAQRERWHRRIERMEQDVAAMRLGERFINA